LSRINHLQQHPLICGCEITQCSHIPFSSMPAVELSTLWMRVTTHVQSKERGHEGQDSHNPSTQTLMINQVHHSIPTLTSPTPQSPWHSLMNGNVWRHFPISYQACHRRCAVWARPMPSHTYTTSNAGQGSLMESKS